MAHSYKDIPAAGHFRGGSLRTPPKASHTGSDSSPHAFSGALALMNASGSPSAFGGLGCGLVSAFIQSSPTLLFIFLFSLLRFFFTHFQRILFFFFHFLGFEPMSSPERMTWDNSCSSS
jgi:hypothetical protein